MLWKSTSFQKLCAFHESIKNETVNAFMKTNISVDDNRFLIFDFFKEWIDMRGINEIEIFLNDLENDYDKRENESTKYIKMLADTNNKYAMHLYAFMLQDGEGIEKNITKAFQYYKRSMS